MTSESTVFFGQPRLTTATVFASIFSREVEGFISGVHCNTGRAMKERGKQGKNKDRRSKNKGARE
jgi:hypothetical protein